MIWSLTIISPVLVPLSCILCSKHTNPAVSQTFHVLMISCLCICSSLYLKHPSLPSPPKSWHHVLLTHFLSGWLGLQPLFDAVRVAPMPSPMMASITWNGHCLWAQGGQGLRSVHSFHPQNLAQCPALLKDVVKWVGRDFTMMVVITWVLCSLLAKQSLKTTISHPGCFLAFLTMSEYEKA